MDFLMLWVLWVLWAKLQFEPWFLPGDKRLNRRRIQLYEKAAMLARLTDVQVQRTIVTARSGGMHVHFQAYGEGNSQTRDGQEGSGEGTVVTIPGNSGLTLQLETLGSRLDKKFGASEITIGHQAFDAAVYIRGEVEMARAVLDAETRSLVLALLRGEPGQGIAHAKVEIVNGGIVARFPSCRSIEDAALVASAVPALLRAARKLDAPADLPGRLARNNLKEPESEVRLRNILLLVANHPRHPATREALRLGCQDPHEEIQLRSALAMGEEGHALLLEIASREWAEDRCAALAVAALGSSLAPDRALAILRHALRSRRVETARACIETLGSRADATIVATLAKVLAVEHGLLAAAAAKALGASEQIAAEAPLLEALVRRSTEVRVAAADALARVGSAAAVLPLKDVAGGPGVDAAVRRAARQAVAGIQSRLSGASPGQLSLAEGDAGRLSLADQDPRGQLSIADASNISQRPPGSGVTRSRPQAQ